MFRWACLRLDEEQEVIAEATYVPVRNGIVDVQANNMLSALRCADKRTAGQLMYTVADELRKKGLKAVASCSYADARLMRNQKAYADIIA
ncbi:MAG: N-acetyltransferase [Eubacteriales bacterium]